MTLAYDAMMFAREVHKNQKRKYTNNLYSDHLAEVAGIVSTVIWAFPCSLHEAMLAVSWGHDSMEDQGITQAELTERFGIVVSRGIFLLSDLEEGNRATRKALSRERLSKAPAWVQTIKCADLISNTSSIVQHDPDFAKVYLEEKRLSLEVMTEADPRLRELAFNQIKESL